MYKIGKKIENDFKNEYEYRECEYLNYSKLSKFYTHPSLVDKEVKSSAYASGHYFESKIKAKILGDDKLVNNYFFIENKPDRRTKAGKLQFNEILQDANGKEIILLKEKETLDLMVENTLSLKSDCIKGTLGDFLYNYASFDVSITWEVDGVKKKCLLDFLVKDENGRLYPFDIKTTRQETKFFNYAIKEYNYWIQDIHYCEGVANYFNTQEVNKMSFVVSSKFGKLLSQLWEISEETRQEAISTYYKTVEQYVEWTKGNYICENYINKKGSANFKLN